MIETNDFRVGTMFEQEGQVMSIITVQHIKMARAGAVIKAKTRNVLTGAITEQSFRSGDKFKTVRIEKGEATYLYTDGHLYHFMDTASYEQVPLGEEIVEGIMPYLKEGEPAFLLRYQDRVIGAELPITVILKVVETDPGFKGDTVSGATKPATLETGARINVPLFLNSGDMIKVDTRNGTYVERA